MYPVLILREELVCLIILIFLALISRTYRMGTDGKVFNRLLTCALVHVVMDAVTVWTVNHTDSVPGWLNYGAHVIFYLAAMLYAEQILIYVVRLFYPDRERKWHIAGMGLIGAYILLLPVLKIEYGSYRGTCSSFGSAVYLGYAIGFIDFIIALFLILRNRNRLSRHVKAALLPMLMILVAAEITQIFVREFLFTGGAVTIVTVGFFFSLENPVTVLERKAMMDAMTGVENRNCYERDIVEYEKTFQNDPGQQFIFLFADLNNLKSVNGMYGHDTGDEYITFVAVMMLTCLKSAEHIYRMGGDEFLAVYRNVNEDEVIRGIEQIRETCEKEAKKKRYVPMLATGYAISGPQYRSLHDVLRVADYMMYQNKAELKREVAMEVRKSGTGLNLTGLMDRVFDAICLVSDRYYPFIQNMETGVTRISPAMSESFGLEGEFFGDFTSVWSGRIHPDDLPKFRDDLTAALKGQKQYHDCVYRVKDKTDNYVEVTCRGAVYHGRDGEADIFSGYIVNNGKPETPAPEARRNTEKC